MNAPLKLANLHPYEAVTEEVFCLGGIIAPIGDALLKKHSQYLVAGRTKWTFVLLTGPEVDAQVGNQFVARANLIDAVGRAFSREPTSSATLALAEAAIQRIANRGDESVHEWASKLSDDLATHDD